MEDNKLHNHFVDRMSRIGRIKRAWFTTFNLDISFFEKYILSTLLSTSYNELNTSYDFEKLSASLANNEDFKDEKTEVRVFYDYRALQFSVKPKQTPLLIHPVDVRRIKSGNGILFSNGVFHPKVSLFETYDGDFWLMASSANLTFGGWANNRESFFFEKVSKTSQARKVAVFFKSIFRSVRLNEENEVLTKLGRGKFRDDDSKWEFVSSFDEMSFLNHLNSSNILVPLQVWSPYFADNFSQMTSDLLRSHFSELNIIPAKNDNQKIRIPKAEYENSIKFHNIKFFEDELPKEALESFVHGKVWLTNDILAIGSWNMTLAGMNIGTNGNNNIEAGIIYNLSLKENREVTEQYSLKSLSTPHHFETDELDKEREEILDKYAISVDLIADWSKELIRLVNPTYGVLIKQLLNTDLVRLPGVGQRRMQELENGISFANMAQSLLTDRLFEILDKNGNVKFRGYLREEGLNFRPSVTFENIDDYLKAWVTERPEDKDELHKYAYKTEEDTGDEFSLQTRDILIGSNQNSWFSSFHAFECIANRIRKTKEMYAKDRENELIRIGRILPGSLRELRSHLIGLIELFESEPKTFKRSPIYLWFLIEKSNELFRFFNSYIKLEREHVKKIKNFKLEDHIEKEELDKMGVGNFLKWKAFIRQELKIGT